jgi:heme-degrading monooxygenase HmoA
MTAFNIVRFKVKPGREQEFIDTERAQDVNFKGFRRLSVVKTGDRTFCFVGEWDSYDDIVAARPAMIQQLDKVRGLLEGVTDPVSGEAVISKP